MYIDVIYLMIRKTRPVGAKEVNILTETEFEANMSFFDRMSPNRCFIISLPNQG